MTIAISPEVRNILERSRIDGKVLILPTTMARRDYLQVDRVLQALGACRQRKHGGHVFEGDPATALATVLEVTTFTAAADRNQLIQTPNEYAEWIARLANVKPGQLALEPSAGFGRLVQPLVDRGAVVTAIDVDSASIKVLQRLGNNVTAVCADFVDWVNRKAEIAVGGDAGIYDLVAMHPPSARDQDMLHTMLAWHLLKPGGRLFSICSEAAFHRDSGLSSSFQAWLRNIGADVEPIAKETFLPSGTDLPTRLIVATK